MRAEEFWRARGERIGDGRRLLIAAEQFEMLLPRAEKGDNIAEIRLVAAKLFRRQPGLAHAVAARDRDAEQRVRSRHGRAVRRAKGRAQVEAVAVQRERNAAVAERAHDDGGVPKEFHLQYVRVWTASTVRRVDVTVSF